MTPLHWPKVDCLQEYVSMTAVKQEADTTSDISGGQITHDEPRCRKHNKPYEYIHRPRKASSIRKFKGEPCIHYLDEFCRHVVWGNTVKLYNHNVRKLRKIIRSTIMPDRYYVCHMTETFATDGKKNVL